jgi:hypothetical protein
VIPFFLLIEIFYKTAKILYDNIFVNNYWRVSDCEELVGSYSQEIMGRIGFHRTRESSRSVLVN